MWDDLIKHVKIYGFLLKINAMRQLEYRLNIALNIMVEMGYLLVKLIYAYIIHDTGVHIAGLSPDSIYLFIGTYMLMTVFFVSMLQFNIIVFDKQIRDGDFDLILTKPISSQFMATLKHVDTWISIPNIIAGIGLIVYGWQASSVPVSAGNILGFLGFVALGIVTMYGLFVLPLLLAFKFKNISALQSFYWAMWDFNNLPHKIHFRPVQLFGAVMFPLFLITNWSPLFVLDQLSSIEIAWGIAAPIILFSLTRVLWKKALHYYESATS
ncbi:ABC transporter permease [Enterovibrio nigricans]|uniref:ABC-2 type transport system permease protein n=1 Tax=Enterovibrio nigricans DSM 22720 TaxID=1121868 RepID=A0A1T4VLH6_9GAMM|nr:ABC-2 family transporter protein [Enterovibrio nigricans]PKF49623.1 ABC transporter permease [Enterovibrio nigricans]SKA65783.1 ABC-2 type transport system permease protein [Enterovibrio nigricans DSM 22720]